MWWIFAILLSLWDILITNYQLSFATMRIVRLFTYCLKSSRGLERQSVMCKTSGFLNDRVVAVIDSKNKVITGREYPKLLRFSSSIQNDGLELTYENLKKFSFPLPILSGPTLEVKLFRNTVTGYLFSNEANTMISNLLEGDFRLIYIGDTDRPLLEKRGGKSGEFTAYADSSPVHLLNLKTLTYLNSKLKDKVSLHHFRPNMVIDDLEPFEEDSWSLITINGQQFRVQEPTQRCIFTTINPDTQTRDEQLEPLSTIAKIRRESGLSPTFGINLVPLSAGTIEVGQHIKIEK